MRRLPSSTSKRVQKRREEEQEEEQEGGRKSRREGGGKNRPRKANILNTYYYFIDIVNIARFTAAQPTHGLLALNSLRFHRLSPAALPLAFRQFGTHSRALCSAALRNSHT